MDKRFNIMPFGPYTMKMVKSQNTPLLCHIEATFHVLIFPPCHWTIPRPGLYVLNVLPQNPSLWKTRDSWLFIFLSFEIISLTASSRGRYSGNLIFDISSLTFRGEISYFFPWDISLWSAFEFYLSVGTLRFSPWIHQALILTYCHD